MRLSSQVLGLCAAGSLLGVAANPLTPRPARLAQPVQASADAPGATCELPNGRFPSIQRISVEEAKPLCVACTALFVDARSAPEYEAGHVAGALHLAPGEPVDPVLWRLGVYATVIVYDRDPTCSQADQVAKAILERGASDVRVLTGAWPAWTAAGAPESGAKCASCTEGPARAPERSPARGTP